MTPSTNIIPPLTVVKLTSDDPTWKDQKGTIFRVGYYSKQDGLDCVWLVDDNGVYCQTSDQDSIGRDFAVLKLSDEADMFGDDRDVIGRRNEASCL